MIKKFDEFINELYYDGYREPKIYDVLDDEETSKFFTSFNGEYNEKLVDEFNRWLRRHKEDYIRLYHGTSEKNPIMDKGILTTSLKRKKSFQSECGYVYLSVYPDFAKTFGEFGYPYDKVVVYSVVIKIKELKPDTDQLNNKRVYDEDLSKLRNTLADSLIYGSGARVKRSIKPYEINLHK